MQSVGGDGSLAPTPKDGDGGAGSAQPPKHKTDDGGAESSPSLPKRLLLDAWSTTYGHRLSGVQTGMVKLMISRFQTSFDPLAMDKLYCPMLGGKHYVTSNNM